MRTAFIHELIKLARNNKRIFLVVGDLGFSVVEPFRDEFPERFLNAGVAEQNMTGLAAGLAKEGFTVFTYSIGNFPTLRALEQIRYDICYHDLSVNIVSVGAGYAYGSLGASHHATEDIGIMRTLPNMRVFSPADPREAQLVTDHVCNYPGPSYLRLGKAGEQSVHSGSANLSIEKILLVASHEKAKTAVLATGSILKYAFDYLAKAENPVFDLYSVPLIKPIDVESLVEIANKYSKIITLEEHQRSAGFGSAVIETISDLEEDRKIKRRPIVHRIAIPDKFISIGGTQEYLREIAGIELVSSDFD